METIEVEKCTVCESSIIDDIEKGERICSGCGIVMAEHMKIMVQKQKAVV